MVDCVGQGACATAAVDAGDDSCTGTSACREVGARTHIYAYKVNYPTSISKVGAGSCVGREACYGLQYANIGTNSCLGTWACRIFNKGLIIGDESCKCDNCCDCLMNYDGGRDTILTIPSNSCNSLAPSPEDIDWVNNGGADSYTYCCSSA